MKILLDTHAFIGLDSVPNSLSETAATICKDPENALFLSIASIWEMQIKISLGKLRLSRLFRKSSNGNSRITLFK